MPRILRSKGVLKLLTNPRTNAKIYNTAKELGVDVGDNRWLMSQVAQESVPLQLRQTINTVVRQFYLQQYQEATKDVQDRAGQIARQIQNSSNEQGVRVTETDFSSEIPVVSPTITRPGPQQDNIALLRQIEREKLLGLRN